MVEGANPAAKLPADKAFSCVQSVVAYFPGPDMINFGQEETTTPERFHPQSLEAEATFDSYEWSDQSQRFERVTDQSDRLRLSRHIYHPLHISASRIRQCC